MPESSADLGGGERESSLIKLEQPLEVDKYPLRSFWTEETLDITSWPYVRLQEKQSSGQRFKCCSMHG